MSRYDGTSLSYRINSVGSQDKSTQTEAVVVSDSWLADPSPDSLPQLPNHEISQIISDAIDNLPPGSLLPLEESVFARGSKRNLEYRAEQKTKMASSINARAKASASHKSQHLTEVNKSDQNGLAFSNRFSSIADQQQTPEKDSQITSKPLIGPGLYARSGRPGVPKHLDSEDVKGRIHQYSPTPGVILKFESVDRPLLSRNSSKEEEKPGASSFNYPSTLTDVAETTTLRDKRLPPHLQLGQSSDPVKSEASSISESTQVGSPKASPVDDLAVSEITSHATPDIKSVIVEQETSFPFGSSIASAVKSVALEGRGPSPPHLIKDNQSDGSSFTTKKLPPHLRNAERQIPERPITRSQEPTASALSSPEKQTPHEKDESPATEQVLPISATVAKHNVSTKSAFSISDKFSNGENDQTSVTQQVLIVSDYVTKSNVSTISQISDSGELVPNEKSKSPAPQQSLPATFLVSEASSMKEVGLDLKDALYFNTWPKSEQRDNPPAEIRTVIIRNLPSNATPSLVTSIVFGGALERIDIIQITGKGSSEARVLFLHGKDCQKFYDATANDLVYIFEDRKGVAVVDKATNVDVLSGQVRTYIQVGFTRCLRVMDIRSALKDKELKEKFREKAASHNRMVDDVVIGKTETDLRFVIVRFCDIRHAVHFKAEIAREDEWEKCNIHFSPDPCAN